MSTHSPSIRGILSESRRIISANSRHFLALSFFYLFPIELAATSLPWFLLQLTSDHIHSRQVLPYVSTQDSKSEIPPVSSSEKEGLQLVIFPILLFASFLLNLRTVPIIHSTFRGFHGTPVGFISSFKSILVSFFPLLGTMLTAVIIMVSVIFAVWLYVVAPCSTVLGSLGLDMDPDPTYSLVFFFLITALFLGLCVYMQVEWYLKTVVVVVESQWGLAPLGRSSHLVKGMRCIVFLILLLFGILPCLFYIGYFTVVASAGRIKGGFVGWWVVLQMFVQAGFSTILSLYSMAAQSVVFVYCKALHGELEFKFDEKLGGELEFKIDEKSGKKYGPLPVDVF